MTVSFAELNTVRAFPNLQFDQPVDLQFQMIIQIESLF